MSVSTSHVDDNKIQKTIRIMTNDPAKKTINLSVSADIVKALVVEPLTIDFGEVSQGNTYKKELTIANKGKGVISITKISIVPDVLRIEPSEIFTLSPGEIKTLTVEFIPNDTIKHLDGLLFIYSDLLNEFIKIKAEVLIKQES